MRRTHTHTQKKTEEVEAELGEKLGTKAFQIKKVKENLDEQVRIGR